jgi:hypothetical protein
MLTKRAMKNRLPLLAAAQKLAGELLTLRPKVESDDGKLTLQREMVDIAKKISLLVTGAAVQKYMMKLADEQELLGLISDMVIQVYAMESGLLRAMKTMEKYGDERSDIQAAMVKVFVNDAFDKLETFARKGFAAIAEGDILRTQLSALKKLSRFTPVNTIALRRKIADYTIKAGKYPF